MKKPMKKRQTTLLIDEFEADSAKPIGFKEYYIYNIFRKMLTIIPYLDINLEYFLK